MERAVVAGKKKMESKEEEEMEMLLNEIPRVTSPQQNQNHFLQRSGGFPVAAAVPASAGGSGGYGDIARPSTYLGRSNASSLMSQGSSPMGGTTSGMNSPVREQNLLMGELGLIQRMGAVHLRNDALVPETTARNGMTTSPYLSGGYAIGDSSTGHSDYLDPQFSYGFPNHNRRPLAANTMAASSSSSSSSSSQFFTIGCSSSGGGGGGFYDGNWFPYVSSDSQRYAIGSDWGNMYLPSSIPTMPPYRDLNSTFAMVGQHLQQAAAAHINAFPREDSFIVQGKDLRLLQSRCSRDLRRDRFNVDEPHCPIRHCCSMFRTLKHEALMGVRGSIYSIAKDQQGCRSLQKKFEERKPEDVEMIFNELVGHFAELMVNSFANYLMQKLFDVCNEEQRLRIIIELTQRPFELVQISLNNHGTRAVQRLIETLHTQQQINMVVSALQPGFMALIVNLNGHHVIQRCLLCLNPDDNKFIFEAAAKHCVRIAIDQHGCCALQRCVVCSTGEYQSNLVMQIAVHGLYLANDRYGNYVVQFIMDLKNPVVNGCLMSQFKGNFVELSTNKFGSNVVEKCLKLWEDARKIIILELLATPQFDMLLQHQYANYVILRALSFKGPFRDALINAIQPHAPVLRTSPYCKKIFSKPYFKKCTSY